MEVLSFFIFFSRVRNQLLVSFAAMVLNVMRAIGYSILRGGHIRNLNKSTIPQLHKKIPTIHNIIVIYVL